MRTAVVMLTRKCNMSCAHCSVASHPGISEEPSAETLRRVVMEMGEAGVTAIQYTGGEPLIRHRLLFELMELAHQRYGMAAAIVSNGFWGKKPERAREFFDKLRSLGLARLTISYDRFHAKFMGPEPVCNILEIARQNYWPVNINVTRTAQDGELADLLAPFTCYENAAFRFYDVQPVGEAQNLNEELRGQLEGFCSGCEQATVCDDGRMAACNGPAYFEPEHSALILGHTATTDLAELLKRHTDDPILQTIRLSGPTKLRETLQSLPEFHDYPFKESYSGMCELCREICGNSKAVKALRDELSRPELVALRLAQLQVKKSAREEVWHREAINTFEARRVLFLALSREAPRHRPDIRRILGRADVDWYRLGKVVVQNKLSGKLLARRELLEDSAPSFFWGFLTEPSQLPEPPPTLVELLSDWCQSDFQNILTLAVALDETPELLEQLSSAQSLAPRVAHFLLASNGLLAKPSVLSDASPSLRERVARRLGQAALVAQPYRHTNLFVTPALHLLLGNLSLAGRAFSVGFSKCRRLRGGKETARLMANDLLKANKAFGLN